MTIREEIYTTTDYSKFSLIKGNRPIKEERVNSLAKDIEQYGLVNPVTIYYDKKKHQWYIMDGQHRSEVCKKLNIPIRYIIHNKEYETHRDLLDAIRGINKNQKNWVPTDIGNSYSATEHDEYYERYMQLVNMGVSHSFVLKACEEFSKDGECEVGSKAFGRGDLVISDEVFEKVQMQISMLQNSKIDRKIWNRQYFIRALMKLRRMENFDVYKFIENFEKFPYEWKNCYQVNDNIKSILHVHNYKNRKKAKYYFE